MNAKVKQCEKSRNWVCYSHENYPNNKLYITTVDKEIIKEMPSSTITYVERKSILNKIKNLLSCLLSI